MRCVSIKFVLMAGFTAGAGFAPAVAVAQFTAADQPATPAPLRLAPPRADAAVPAGDVDSIDALVAAALRADPALKAGKGDALAMRKMARSMRMMMPPMVGVTADMLPVDSFALNQEPMTGIQLMVEQTFPYPGKNAVREELGLRMAEVKRWRWEESRVMMAGQLRRAYWQLTLTRRLEHLTVDHLALVKQLVQAVRLKYEVGKGAQHDLLRLEVLRDKLADRLDDFARQQVTLTAVINTPLARPPTTPVRTPAAFPAFADPPAAAALTGTAEHNRPMLKMYTAEAGRDRFAAAHSRNELDPDFTVRAGYRLRMASPMGDGTDMVMLGFAMPLPVDWLQSYDHAKDAALTAARTAEFRREALLNEIRGKIEIARAAWRRAATKAERYATQLRPAAEKTLAAVINDYQLDRAPFTTLLDAEMELIDLDRDTEMARFEAIMQHVMLDELIGYTGVALPAETVSEDAEPLEPAADTPPQPARKTPLVEPFR